MISGVDVSKYQTPDALDGWDFAILNHEDPTFSGKLDRCVALGIPYAFYGWLYPGRGREALTRMKAHDELLALNGDRRPEFYWLDYEQSGVSPGDLADGLQAAADTGVAAMTGTYSYLAVISTIIDVIARYGSPLWLAYYPGSNDGSYPAGQDGAARRWGAVLWQYSSGGNLDRNVVIDEAWYHAHHGGDDMTEDEVRKIIDQHVFLEEPYGMSRFVAYVEQYLHHPTIYGYTRFEAWWKQALAKFGVKP